MRRTLEHCSLITKYGKPRQYDGKCEGFCVSEQNDEPCTVCKTCKLQADYEEESDCYSADCERTGY